MGKRVPAGLRISPQGYRPGYGKRKAPQQTVKPEQIALEKNADVINNVATRTRGRGIRNTPFRLPYLSNLRKMDPVFDDPYEVAAQTIRKTRKPGDPDIVLDPDGLYDEDDTEGNDNAAGLPAKLEPTDTFEEFSKTSKFEALMATTGMSMEEITSLRKRSLVSKMVSNQIRTGKVRSLWVMWVVGNGDGMVGYGEGKSVDGATANNMAMIQAIKSMVPVDRYEGRTVFGNLAAKFGASQVYLRARPPGFGIRANYYVHEVCRCAGISDVGGKVRGSMNGMNVVKAVFEALRNQKSPTTIAKQRGMHVIDVRERYFHGR
jgi:small subunit ribosomal protein S5